MRSCILFFAGLLFFNRVILAQTELVPNGGFESYGTCPVGFSEFDGYVSSWYNPNTASPDYMNACANPFPAGVPVNGIGYQVPHGGNAYAGMYALPGTFFREFIQVQLVSPLVAGITYNFSMYVVLHNKSNTAVDDIGAYFSATAPTAAGTGMLAGAPLPQISNPAGSVITDTLNWTLISGTYTASGGEDYLTLGHLKPDASTIYQSLPTETIGAYYYYDDVSLKEATVLPITLLSFSGEPSGQVAGANELQWTTATEENNCCFYVERSSDGLNYFTIGVVQGSGTTAEEHTYIYYDAGPVAETSYYHLKQVDDDGNAKISGSIAVKNEAGEATVLFSNGIIHFTDNSSSGMYAIIYDMAGRVIAEQRFASAENQWDPGLTAQGLYILKLMSPNGALAGVYKFEK